MHKFAAVAVLLALSELAGAPRLCSGQVERVEGALLCAQEEKVENPQYKAWASFKAGSWVKHKMVMDAGGRAMEIETTATLLEVTPEKLILEQKQKMDVGGRTMELPAKREEVAAKVEKGKCKIKVTEKQEELTVAGKTLKCTLWETEMEQGGDTMQGKSWVSPEIPGGTAQGEFSSPKLPKPMKLTATGWEKK